MSLSAPVNFLTLIEDVFSRVLSFCGVSGVLAVSQTCTHFRTLAFQKQVWLALLRDLDARLFLDPVLGRPLHELTTTDLIDLVKRIVRGPKTWSPLHAPPRISGQHILRPNLFSHNMQIGSGVFLWEHEAKLLRGGRYVLFNNSLIFGCWNVAENRFIWRHQSQTPGSICGFADEVVNDGRAVTIMLCMRTDVAPLSPQNIVEIVQLDFLTETSNLLFSTRAPDTVSFAHATICGDIAAVGLCDQPGPTKRLFLMNWKTRCVILLPMLSKSLPVAALVPEHVIMIEPGRVFGQSCIGVWNIHSFEQYWTPSDEFTGHPVHIDDVPKLVSTNFNHGLSLPGPLVALSAHESPLREGLYSIWVYVFSIPRSICKFSLLLSPPSPLQFHLRFCGSFRQEDPIFGGISYAGHTGMFDYRNEIQQVISLSEWNTETKSIVELSGTRKRVHMSPYSGALTDATHDSIVINYYH